MENSTHSIKSWLRFIPSIKEHYLVLTLFTIFSFIQFGFATDYYFSSSTGNDSRTATEAQNSSTPWKSIEKLNSISSILKGGDRILFKSGDTFYGSIKITKSGSSGAPIIFTSYGTGAKPIITSLVKLNNLVSIGNGKYEADLSAYNLNKIQVVTINDQIKEIGRYPNSDAPDGGYLRIANVNSSTSISTSSSNPFSGTTGEVVIRKNNWIIDRHAITNISGTTISFEANESIYFPLKNYGYFLQNHSSLLDLPGEWSYDRITKKLTINLSGINMSTVNVSVATLDNLVTNNQYTTNLTFSNLHFKGSNSHLLNITRSENVKVENSVMDYAGENAFYTFDVRGLVIQNNQINYSLNSGIYIYYGAPGSIIRENTITNTMAFQGMSRSSDMNGIGIYLASDGDGSLIEKNKVINTGYNAIHFGGSYTKVVNNLVDNFCLFKQDGGGIYMNSDGFRDRNNVGREITGNIILNGIGTKLGTTEEVDIAEGIYLDDNTAGVKVSKNTIAFISGKSILLHNANNIDIRENLFYKAHSHVQYTHDHMGDPIRYTTVTQNQFSSIEKTEKIYSVYSIKDDIGSIGTFNSNYFLDPFQTDFFIHTKGASDASGVSRNLSNWRSNFGYDANSLKPELNIPTFKVTSSTLIKESDFSSNTSIIAGVYGATSQLVSSGISGGTLKLTPTSTNNATVYIQIGAIQTGQKIMIEFDMKGNPVDIPVELFLEGTFNIDKGLSNGKAASTSAPKSHKIILSSLTAKSNESIVFRIPPTATELFLDNIKISRVTTEDIDKESYIFFDYNPTGTAVQKPLDGTYINAKNETFSGSVTIPSFGSVLLAKVSESTTPVPNQKPTISLTNPTPDQIFINGVNPVELVANAQDPEGKIKQVEFYNGTTLLATVSAAPYTHNWTNIQNGTYSVYAKVIDEGNLSAISSTVNFTVKAEEPAAPAYTAQMISPVNNSIFELGSQPVVLKTNAAASGLIIQKVEFFNWGFPLVTVNSGSFEFNWTAIEVDTYNIHAIVTDSKGNGYTTSPIKFTVKAKETATNQAPTVSLTNPTSGQVFINGVNPVELVANAQDPEGKIKQVEFYNGTILLATDTSAPYSYNWTNIQNGTYSVSAKVIDEGNLSATSSPVSFTVQAANQAPTVSLTNPTSGQVFINGVNPVELVANAQDPEGKIKQVEFYNGTTLLATDTSAPYSYNWTNIQNGTYSVSAKVIDEGNLSATSSPVSFTVQAANQAPTVSLTNPTSGQVFINGVNPVELVANAQDPEGKIKQVEFYNGTTLLAIVTAAPYSYNWTNIQNGTYSVSAKVIDEGNLSATSTPVSFTVKDEESTLATYSAQMVSPINNSTFEIGSQPVVLKTNASTSGLSIQKVEYFNWGSPLVTVTSGNFEFNWTSIDVDTYKIHAKVTDNKGKVYTTPFIRFTVKAASVPPVNLGVNLVQPSDNQTFILGEQVVKLKADVSSSTKIKNIKFYNWGTPLANINTAPYEFDWTKITVGSYKVHAVVTDVNGKTSTSNSVSFQVIAASSNQTNTQSNNTEATTSVATVEIVQPSDNQVFELGKSTVVLKANASEKVSKVEFFNWYEPLVTVTNATNEFSWTKIEAGEYFVSARITDSKGNVIDSAPIRFKVIASNSTSTGEEDAQETKPVSSEDNVLNLTGEKVNMEENKKLGDFGIKMGPNPTTSHLNIFFEEYPENQEGKVSVLDLRGVELFKSDFNTSQKSIKLDLSYLKPGIYVVKLNFGNKVFQSHKLIKN